MLGFSAVGQLALGEVPRFPVATVAAWGCRFSEPTRRKWTPARTDTGFVRTNPYPQITIGWYRNLTDPTRRSRRPTGPATSWAAQSFFPYTTIGWIYPYSNPVRVLPRLRDGLQQTSALTFPTPYRLSGALIATEQRDIPEIVIKKYGTPGIPRGAYVSIVEFGPYDLAYTSISES